MILDRFRMNDRVAIVTGGSKGIGRGIARAFAEAGGDVTISSRNAADLEKTAAELRKDTGRRVLAVPCDVNDRAQLEAVVEATWKEFGRIDVVVNNAGGTPPKPALRTSEKMFEAAFHFNVTSAFLLSRLAIPKMLEGGDGGAILNISSGMSWLVEKGFVAYGTAKAALSFMTKQLGAELAPRVRVNALAVGAVDTAALRPFLTDEIRSQMEALTPMRSIGTVEDIAIAACWLCTPAGGWVTGKVIEVDGGTESTNWPFD